jgi:hypothetical protein
MDEHVQLATYTSFTLHSSPNSLMEELTKNLKRRQGKVKLLSAAQLQPILDDALLSRDSTELAFMHLIDDYEFDLDVLKAKLVGA